MRSSLRKIVSGGVAIIAAGVAIVLGVLPGNTTPAPVPAVHVLPAAVSVVDTGDYATIDRPRPIPAALPAPIVYTVHGGDTLWLIAQGQCGTGHDWPGLYQANHAVIGANYNALQVGEKLTISCDPTVLPPAPVSGPAIVTVAHTTPLIVHHASPAAPVSIGDYSGFQACVIRRESGGNPNVMNASRYYGLYQFSFSTWVANGGSPATFGHASVAEQNQVFANAMAKPGGRNNWAPYDGC